ncbi:MAG: hypothetical protein TECD_00088 [Hyphomicrobiaceae bacterium hypho_1]
MFEKKLFNSACLSQAGLVLALTISISLSGCGVNSLRPIYASSYFGKESLADKLSSIKISNIPGRAGQIIRNELKFQNSGGKNSNSVKYRLDITVTERITSTLVSSTGDSAGQIYQIDANFKLIDILDDTVIIDSFSYGRAGFERFGSIFSNVRAREDATRRAATTVARDIKSQLELSMSRIKSKH